MRHLFSALVWLLLGGLPLLVLIAMTVLTSKVGVGTTLRAHNYLLIPEETKSPAVLRCAWQLASQLAKQLMKAAPRLERQQRDGRNFLLLN